MEAAQALDVLKAYRAFVRRDSNEMPGPTQVGLAIDVAVSRPSSAGIGIPTLLARFNAWRRDDSETPLGRLSMPDPKSVSDSIDYVINNWEN